MTRGNLHGYRSGMNGHTPRPMRLVIIDDHQMVLDGLKAMLGPYREQVQVVGDLNGGNLGSHE